MSAWKEYTLEEVIECFIDYRGKTPKKTDSGVPLITAKIVKNGTIFDPNEFIDPKDYHSWMTRGFPQINDVVLTTEAPLGEVALLKNEKVALAQRIITLRGKKEILYNPFLKYYFQSTQGQYELQSRASGTTVFGIKAEVLRKVPILLPPLPEQRAIVSVLSSLDDKIDLLHRQNNTLEGMAEALFRKWFVEGAEEYSENQLNMDDLIESISISHSFPSSKIIFLNTSDIYLGDVINHGYDNVNSLPGQAKKAIKQNDILFSEIRPANGRYAYIDFESDDYVVSTKLMVLRSKGVLGQAFVYFYLTHPMTLEWLQALAEGRSGTFPQITFDQLRTLKINIPSDQLLKSSSQSCECWLSKSPRAHARGIKPYYKLRLSSACST